MDTFYRRIAAHALLLAVVAFVITAHFAHALPYPRTTGYAAYYRPGRMAQVARTRGLPVVACMVASPYHPIGAWVTVTSAKGTRACRVTDVPLPRDLRHIIRRGIVVELSYDINRQLCPVNEPPRKCPVEVRR
jgi:hypothetical protein